MAKTGTKEWAGDNVNIQIGCENGCRYCYARWGAVKFHKYCGAEAWPNPRINQAKVDKNYRLYKDGVMFPSTHDITSRNISECLCVLRKLLEAGNKVLIVSKPHWDCIPLVCESLLEWQKNVEFRFTIGSTNDDVLGFWEPDAPRFDERLGCLQYAYNKGYKTSISCEPYLDQFPEHVHIATEEYVKGDFWVGMLKDFDNRVVLDGVTEQQMTRFVKPLKALQNPMIVKAMYKQMNKLPRIKWKDTVWKVINCETD